MRNFYLLLTILFYQFGMAQKPVISYPTPNIFKINKPITPLVPTNTGGSLEIQVSTFAGSGSAGSANDTGAAASFNAPGGIAYDSGSGILYVADTDNHIIRQINSSGVVSTLAGSGTAGFADGTGTAAQFNSPIGIVYKAGFGGNFLYVADSNNNRIRAINVSTGEVNTYAGSGGRGSSNGDGNLATTATFDTPTGVAADAYGDIYVADSNNHLIRKITGGGTAVEIFAGSIAGSNDGTGINAQFRIPLALAVDSARNVYVADSVYGKIRKITPAGVVTTLNGNFSNPSGVAVDSSKNVYVANSGRHIISKISVDGVVSVLAGNSSMTSGSTEGDASVAKFSYPSAVAVDGMYGYVYL